MPCFLYCPVFQWWCSHALNWPPGTNKVFWIWIWYFGCFSCEDKRLHSVINTKTVQSQIEDRGEGLSLTPLPSTQNTGHGAAVSKADFHPSPHVVAKPTGPKPLSFLSSPTAENCLCLLVSWRGEKGDILAVYSTAKEGASFYLATTVMFSNVSQRKNSRSSVCNF